MAVNLILCFLLFFAVVPGAYADYDDSMEYYAKAKAAYTKRNLNEAEGLLKKSISSDGSNEHAYILLGEVLYLKQDMTGAAVNFKKALDINPRLSAATQRLEKIKKENTVEAGFKAASSGIFDVRLSSGEAMAGGAEKLLECLQEAYNQIGRQFDYYPSHPVVVLFYSEDEFRGLTKLPPGVSGLFDGKVRLPVAQGDYFLSGPFKSTLWHEYAHAVVYDLSAGKAPLWFNEAVAMFAGSMAAPQQGSSVLDKALLEGKTIPFKNLFNPIGLSFDAQLLYQQCGSIAEYIMHAWGPSKIKAMLAEFSKGAGSAAVVKSALGMDTGAFQRRWLSWAKEGARQKYGDVVRSVGSGM